VEAELELKARLQEQMKLRRRNRLRFFFLPFIWTWSLLQALVAVGRNQPEAVDAPRHEAPTHSGAASLDRLPVARPHAPAEDKAAGPVIGWAPPPTEEIRPLTYETPATAEPVAPPEHPETEWPDAVEPAPPPAAPGPAAPHKDWRPHGAPVGSEAAPKQPPKPAPPAYWPGDVPEVEAPAAQVPAEPTATEEQPATPVAEAPAVPVPPPAAPVVPAPVAPAAAVPPPVVPAPALPTEVIFPPAPLPPQPTQQLGPGELLGVFLGTCMRSAGAEVGVLVLLQDDVLVVRASSGVDAETAAHLALETLGDLCLDVVGGATPVRAYQANPGIPDPYHPRAILCVPILIADAGAGAVLLVGYAPGREFSAVHERLASNLARTAGPTLARAGAYKLSLDRPGDRWRRLDQVGTRVAPAAPEAVPAAPPITEHGTGEITGSPMSTMTLDPEAMRRLIAGAKAARGAQEAEAAAEEQAALAAEAARRPPLPPQAEPEVEEAPGRRLPEWEKPAADAGAEPPTAEPTTQLPASLEPDEPAVPKAKKPGWRERVGSRMTRVAEQREEDEARYRREILGAVRNLSWDGYQALIADIYRRKAFEVFPPPVSGSDLDVIDLVVDRDGQRMLINCQLRGEMDIPGAAVTEMGNVVANYSVAGAYLIADGSFAPEAAEAAAASGVVLIDGEALIDLVIETTLKDESKPSGFGRLAKRFSRAS
jgi:hypothetical protein